MTGAEGWRVDSVSGRAFGDTGLCPETPSGFGVLVCVCTPKGLYPEAQGQHAQACATLGNHVRAVKSSQVKSAPESASAAR
jgi:hypothetical protein